MQIRDAKESDAAAIAEIYNEAVQNSTAVWNDITVDAKNRAAWILEKKQQGFPLIVATENDKVLGYATYGKFRPFDGYEKTVEHSIYIHKDSRRNGAGKILLTELILRAQKQRKHIIVAAIESSNIASIKLHEKLGFQHVGIFKEVGVKFGTMLDLTCLQLNIGAHL